MQSFDRVSGDRRQEANLDGECVFCNYFSLGVENQSGRVVYQPVSQGAGCRTFEETIAFYNDRTGAMEEC